MPKQAARLDNLPPYIFVSIAQQIQKLTEAGHEILRLDIGNPDLPPQKHVVDALYDFAQRPDTHGYAGYRGIPSFRKAIADHYLARFGVELDPETEVLPLIGSKEGIVNLSFAYLDRGDVVLVPSIGYPAYAMGAKLAGADVEWVPTPAEHQFRIDVSQLTNDQLERAKLLWINYPNNPTGATADTQFYQQLVDFCQKHDILLASDNPYVEITYDNYQAGSVLQANHAKDIAVEFMSFSKAYNMAGWRLGAAVGNAEAIKRLLHVKSNVDSGHFKAIYQAGIQALQATPEEWLQERNAIYQNRRDMLMDALPEMGLEAHKPRAAMYIWAKIQREDLKQTYTDLALQQAHVSLAPGAAYGPQGEGYVRMSVGVPDDTLKRAIDQLKSWYQQV